MNPDSDKPIVALIYDFDKTLSTKDMQNYSFIPSLKMSAKKFWAKSNALAEENKMDHMLAYMFIMLSETKLRGKSITRENLQKWVKKLNSTLELQNGLTISKNWLRRIMSSSNITLYLPA